MSTLPFFRRPSPLSLLHAAGTSALLVTNLTNIRYLTGVQASAGIALVLPKRIELFLDGRYHEAASRIVTLPVILRPVEELNETLRSLKRTAYECDDVTVARLLNWQRKFKNTKFVQTSGIVEEFRRTKQKEELECILRACSITKAVLARVPRLLKPGVTERDIAWELERRCRKLGAEGMAFESIVAFSHNTASPHHRPSSRILKRGDIVQIDMGAKFNGYCSDYSRVFYTAEPTPEQRKVERAVMAAFRAAKAKVRPGVDVQSLDATAREALKKFGFDKEFCHALGHGVGLDIHEGVSLSSRAKKGTRLKKGEVITIEPGVYIAGKFGMRIEDTVVVK